MLVNIVSVLVAAAAVVVVLGLLVMRYKRCPPGKLLVVYGSRLSGGFAVLDSGGRFVLPLVQQCECLSLAPMELPKRSEAGYPRAVRIGDTAELRRNAVELLGLSQDEIVARVEEILEQTGPHAQLLRKRLAELGLETA